MKFIHGIIENIPTNFKPIIDKALKVAFESWVDEKGTEKHPNVWYRRKSNLTIDEAYNIIKDNKPHWGIHFRNEAYLINGGEDYWEFGGCNIREGNYGSVFIWIKVSVENAEKIFEEFNLIKKFY